MKKISFVIPCYGSSFTLRTVIEEIELTMEKHKSHYEHEVILVNDCSPDDVWQVIQALCQEKPYITGINLAKNFGQHAALMAAYRHASGNIIVSLDDDGQTPADEVFLLIEKIEQGFDVVYGCYADRKDNIFRKAGTYVNKFMSELLIGKPKDIALTSYFASKKFVIDEIIKYDNAYPYIAGLVFRTTLNIINVPVHHRSRKDGHSGYTLGKLLSLWMNGFTAFSVKPLRIASVFGVIVAIIGFLMTIYIVVSKILHPEIAAGYSSLMSVLLIIGGMLMLMLGLLGEYIGRIYISINNSPQYVIKEITKR